MRIVTLNNRSKALLLAALAFVLPWAPNQGYAQNIVVVVNDEPITSFDIEQRMRWNALTHNFGDQMKTLLTGESVKQKFQQMMMAAHPQSQRKRRQPQSGSRSRSLRTPSARCWPRAVVQAARR